MAASHNNNVIGGKAVVNRHGGNHIATVIGIESINPSRILPRIAVLSKDFTIFVACFRRKKR